MAVVVLGALAGHTAERDFALTWTSATLSAGHHDLEAWVTPRLVRADDAFALTEARFVLTAGLSEWLETSAALELPFLSSPTSSTVDPRVSSLWKFAPWKAGGPLGFGGLARVSVGFDVLELEARLFVDKRLGRLLLAANASYERSFFRIPRTGVDTRLEESVGARFALGEHATFGLELRVKSSFRRLWYQGSAVYVGPTMSFRLAHTWVSVGALAQVAADKAKADRGNGEPAELRDNERFVLRLVVGSHTD